MGYYRKRTAAPPLPQNEKDKAAIQLETIVEILSPKQEQKPLLTVSQLLRRCSEAQRKNGLNKGRYTGPDHRTSMMGTLLTLIDPANPHEVTTMLHAISYIHYAMLININDLNDNPETTVDDACLAFDLAAQVAEGDKR